MATSPEDVVNMALVAIGYTRRISDLFEGSAASVAALEVYAETRDEIFDAGEWPLARRANISLVLLKGPPPPGGYSPGLPWSAKYPPSEWLYEYAYPADMVELKAILKRPMAMFDLSPRPATFRIDNDNSLVDRDGAATIQKKVILSNVASALAVYTGIVTDPSLWEPGFTSVMVDKLGQKLSRRLGLGEEVAKAQQAQTMIDMPAAESDRG